MFVVIEMGFSIIFHHMGKFERFKRRLLRYKGEEKHVVRGVVQICSPTSKHWV